MSQRAFRQLVLYEFVGGFWAYFFEKAYNNRNALIRTSRQSLALRKQVTQFFFQYPTRALQIACHSDQIAYILLRMIDYAITHGGERLPLPIAPPPPSYMELYEAMIMDEGEGTQKLGRMNEIQDAYHNQTTTLGRLPDKLLTKIMLLLDRDDILRLRHTSRDFMRLFSESPEFCSYRVENDGSCPKSSAERVWAMPKWSFPNQAAASCKWKLCSSCSAKRQGDFFGYSFLGSMPWLHCSGCETTHRAMHFSALQRHQGSHGSLRSSSSSSKRPIGFSSNLVRDGGFTGR